VIRYLLSTFLTLSCLPAAIAAQGPAPYDIQLDLSFAQASGDEGAREELELQFLSELRRAGCFRSVTRVVHGVDEGTTPDEETLRLSVAVTEVVEETTYDTSVAERTDPRASAQMRMAYTARIEAVMRVSLEHPASGQVLRTKRLRAQGEHRPLIPGEDARGTALGLATRDAADAVRIFVCKGGAKRLRKEIGASSGP